MTQPLLAVAVALLATAAFFPATAPAVAPVAGALIGWSTSARRRNHVKGSAGNRSAEIDRARRLRTALGGATLASVFGAVVAVVSGPVWAGVACLAVAALGGWRWTTTNAPVRTDVGRWEAGAVGEARTAAELSNLPRGWTVCHDLKAPDTAEANIDHLVIGPTGVWLVDTKQLTGTIVADDGKVWHDRPGKDRYPLTQRMATTKWMASKTAAAIGVRVTPVWAVWGAELSWGNRPGRFGPLLIVPAEQLLDVLNRDVAGLDKAAVKSVLAKVAAHMEAA